jgi:hypothetical protein
MLTQPASYSVRIFIPQTKFNRTRAPGSLHAGQANKSVQATAAAPFRSLALVILIRSFCRARSLSTAVPDLWR